MQTFLPYPNIVQSIQCLDNKRLGKQRVEVLQMLKAINQGPQIAFIWDWDDNGKEYKKLLWFKPLNSGDGIIKTPWYNHKCTNIWKGFTIYLEHYMNCCIFEWMRRGFKNNMLFCVINYAEYCNPFLRSIKCPSWFGDKKFHDSHKSNLLRKMPEYYSKFNWDVPNDLPYVWPVN